jgi:hypothetical protein
LQHVVTAQERKKKREEGRKEKEKKKKGGDGESVELHGTITVSSEFT